VAQLFSQPLVELSDHPEVHQPDPPVGLDELRKATAPWPKNP